MARDTEAPRKSYYEKVTKALLDSNARSQAMAFNLSRECTLIEFQDFYFKFAESFSIKSLFESIVPDIVYVVRREELGEVKEVSHHWLCERSARWVRGVW